MLYWTAESLTEAAHFRPRTFAVSVTPWIDAPGTPQSVKVQGVESALTHCMSHGKPAPLRIEGQFLPGSGALASPSQQNSPDH
jgi:hypothetical protein